MKRYTPKVIINEHYKLAESPFWDERTGLLSFVDIIAGKLFTVAPDSFEIKTVIECGQQIGAAVPMEEKGKYLIAGTDGLYVTDTLNSGKIELKKVIDTTTIYETFQRSNDAKCDPCGRLFFGSSVLDDHEASGNLFRYDGNEVAVMQKNTKISNGMAWSKDCTKFFFSDSPYQSVFVYDYDKTTGDISNRRVLFEISEGVPDGLCIDSEDNIWLAVWGGRRIEKRDGRSGELLEVIDVPAENVTSCCFFGPDNDTLLITTSGDGQNGEFDGSIFICKVDAKGTKTDYYIDHTSKN